MAIGFYFYVVLPLWIIFAFLAYRWRTGVGLGRRLHVLTASVALWAIALVSLVSFVTVFGVVIVVAQTLAIVFGTLVLSEASTPHGTESRRRGEPARLGLVGGLTSAVVLFLWGLLNVTRIGEALKIPLWVGGMPASYLVLTATTVSAAVGAFGFLVAANRMRAKA